MKVHIKKSARKELMNLPDRILLKAFEMILDLRDHPWPRGYGKVEGKDNQLRVWINRDYRILYEVNPKIKRIDIVAVRHKDETTYK